MPGVERRQWERLPIAVPFFIRANDSNGEEFVDFSTALNLSAGGLLLATRRHLDRGTAVSLETPAPLSEAQPPRASRYFKARVLRAVPSRHYFLVGLQFEEPILSHDKGLSGSRRQ